MTIVDLVDLRLEDFAPEDRVRNWRMHEVEKLTAFSRAQIGRFVKAGELPAIKFPGAMRAKTGQAGAIRFRLPEILRFIAAHERVGGGPISKRKAPTTDQVGGAKGEGRHVEDTSVNPTAQA